MIALDGYSLNANFSHSPYTVLGRQVILWIDVESTRCLVPLKLVKKTTIQRTKPLSADVMILEIANEQSEAELQ